MMAKPSILLIDDDLDILTELSRYLEDAFAVTPVSTLDEARRILFSAESRAVISVVVADRRLRETQDGGLVLAQELIGRAPRPEVIILTAYPDIRNASDHMAAKTFGYVEKGMADTFAILEATCIKASERWNQKYHPIDVNAPEAILIVDLVGSTETTTNHGWSSVGKLMIHDLRECIRRIGPRYGLRCRKSTGDGYLLTFADKIAAAEAITHATRAMIAISSEIKTLNLSLSEERQIRLRFGLHYGEVDEVRDENGSEDREGPEVSFTFRLEGVDKESLEAALNPMPSEDFPNDNYAVLSGKVVDMLLRRHVVCSWEPIGVLRLKGFPDWYQLYLLRDISEVAL